MLFEIDKCFIRLDKSYTLETALYIVTTNIQNKAIRNLSFFPEIINLMSKSQFLG